MPRKPRAPPPAAVQYLPMLLLRLRETLLQPLRPVLRSFDLTEQQARVLVVLSDVGTVEAETLATLCCLPAATLSRSLDKLEVRGLVRCVDAAPGQPRPAQAVTLTPLGLELTMRLRTALRVPFGQLKRQMTQAGTTRLNEALCGAIALLAEPAAGEA